MLYKSTVQLKNDDLFVKCVHYGNTENIYLGSGIISPYNRSFAKIKPSRKFPHLQFMCVGFYCFDNWGRRFDVNHDRRYAVM